MWNIKESIRKNLKADAIFLFGFGLIIIQQNILPLLQKTTTNFDYFFFFISIFILLLGAYKFLINIKKPIAHDKNLGYCYLSIGILFLISGLLDLPHEKIIFLKISSIIIPIIPIILGIKLIRK